MISEKEIPYEIVKSRQVINLGNELKLEILYPNKDFSGQRVENINNMSIVSRLVYGQTAFLFTGDAEEEEEEEVLRLGNELRSDILKAGHHGSNTASSKGLLDAVQPETVVIQCGRGNKFGHPHLRTLKNLERSGVKIYRNDLDGQVKIISDGYKLEIQTYK